MGWLGWTEAETLATDVNSIELAIESRSELIMMIFGSGKPPGKGKARKAGSQVNAFKASKARRTGKAAGNG